MKAKAAVFSKTLNDGIEPETILQKMQFMDFSLLGGRPAMKDMQKTDCVLTYGSVPTREQDPIQGRMRLLPRHARTFVRDCSGSVAV